MANAARVDARRPSDELPFLRMIKDMSGDLLEAPCEALVNPVNTAGPMGKGLALQFKRRFPENYRAFHEACMQGKVRPGEMFTFRLAGKSPRLIVNFPTKRHWRSRARMEDIVSGLANLACVIREHEIRSIAVPALGCGLGGLDWQEVRTKIVEALSPLDQLQAMLYGPR